MESSGDVLRWPIIAVAVASGTIYCDLDAIGLFIVPAFQRDERAEIMRCPDWYISEWIGASMATK